MTGLHDEVACAGSKRKAYEAHANCDKFSPQDKDEGLFQEASYDRANNGVACSMEKENPVPGENVFWKTQMGNGTKIFPEKNISQDKEKPLSSDPSLSNVQQDETYSTQEEDSVHDTQNDLIGEREKFKESDEYKRAMEEEWTSRQRELQNQAETSRLLDMERRQKQRLEEMRETQKKDVETLNLKKKIRAEVRKVLDKLELKYSDMASLLRYLGINVRGGLHPLPREVHAAYKQAFLKFHPDRASRTDIRQLVEAEEKFKLISRLKEKLLPT